MEDLKIVNCHLGQGASLCAIQNGKSVETSMSLTPTSGIAMCSRSGDLDPLIVTFLMKNEHLTEEEVENVLNNESGVYGMSNCISKDFRDLEEAISEGNKVADRTVDSYCYIVAQTIVKYAVSMQGIDVITFTAGVGENQFNIRRRICEYLKFMGVELDKELNHVRSCERKISSENSKIQVWIVPTDEELMIARDTKRLVTGK